MPLVLSNKRCSLHLVVVLVVAVLVLEWSQPPRRSSFTVHSFSIVSPLSRHAASSGVGAQRCVPSNSKIPYSHSTATASSSSSSRVVCYNFFKDLLDRAFENDDRLSKENVRQGMLDDKEDDDDAANVEAYRRRSKQLTETQEKWRQQQQLLQKRPSVAAATAPTTSGGTSGGVITWKDQYVQSMTNSAMVVNFYLTGVPNKDPSNDLYGSRVNISSRDRQVGLTVPTEPTVSNVQIRLLPGGKCQCETETPFTPVTEGQGDWIVSEDGKNIRLRIPVAGYTRTVETKGSIQSVFWSKETEKTTQTSTVYSIPTGFLYLEASLTGNPTKTRLIQFQSGLCKIEQKTGLLGAATKLVPCGKFDARMLVNDDTTTTDASVVSLTKTATKSATQGRL